MLTRTQLEGARHAYAERRELPMLAWWQANRVAAQRAATQHQVDLRHQRDRDRAEALRVAQRAAGISRLAAKWRARVR